MKLLNCVVNESPAASKKLLGWERKNIRIMASEPTLDTVSQALKALYHSPDASEKERASKWLEEFQKSVAYFLIHIIIMLLRLDVCHHSLLCVCVCCFIIIFLGGWFEI